MSEILATLLFGFAYVVLISFLVRRFHANWSLLFLTAAGGWFYSVTATPPLTASEIIMIVFLVGMALLPKAGKERILSRGKAKRGGNNHTEFREKPKHHEGILILEGEYGHLGPDGEIVIDGNVADLEAARQE